MKTLTLLLLTAVLAGPISHTSFADDHAKMKQDKIEASVGEPAEGPIFVALQDFQKVCQAVRPGNYVTYPSSVGIVCEPVPVGSLASITGEANYKYEDEMRRLAKNPAYMAIGSPVKTYKSPHKANFKSRAGPDSG